MSMDLQRIINSAFAVNLAFFIGRLIPPRIGHPVCDAIGSWIATRRESKLARVVRVNQWVVRGATLEKEALDQAVRETLQNNIRDLYNLYHYIQKPKVMQRMISVHPDARQWLERPEFTTHGLVIVGLHLSNFDFALQPLTQRGFRPMILTVSNPQGGRRVEFEMRKKLGMNLVPASVSSLRQAVTHLQQGGMVLTGIDHPIPNSKHRPRFFSRHASLPTHHIHLALKARVPVVIMAVIRQTDGRYHVFSSDPIEMEQAIDRGKTILCNAERVLRQAEDFIRLAPQQWNVPLPVWPDLVGMGKAI